MKRPLTERLRVAADRLDFVGDQEDREAVLEAAAVVERVERDEREQGQQTLDIAGLPVVTDERMPPDSAAIVNAAGDAVLLSSVFGDGDRENVRKRWGDDAVRYVDRLLGQAREAAARAVAEKVDEGADGDELPGFRATDPDTSRQAALDVYPRAGSRRRVILEAAIEAGERGITWFEVERQGVNEPWKRISELLEGGWLTDTGRIRRNPRTGSKARVYVASGKAAAGG